MTPFVGAVSDACVSLVHRAPGQCLLVLPACSCTCRRQQQLLSHLGRVHAGLLRDARAQMCAGHSHVTWLDYCMLTCVQPCVRVVHAEYYF
jgi:hypothetical protein